MKTFQKVQYGVQIVSVIGVMLGLFFLFPEVVASFKTRVKSSIVALFFGILVADFLSGVAHWAADTWGRETWPIVGPAILKSFRDHHKTPWTILEHDFFETNGDACVALLPILTAGFFFGASGEVAVFLFALSLAVMLTNQAHKLAHKDRTSSVIRLLQNVRILLVRSDHQKHHSKPFVESYCITTGWMNPLLNRIRFWRGAEKVITALTGAIPREDDSR